MPEEQKKQSSNRIKGFIFFILATLCALPFVVISSFVVTAMLTHREILSRPLVSTIFFAPFFLLATVCGVIFIILAWKKGHCFYKPFLFLYSFSIFLYWAMLINSGPW
jgi:hypothetical protein